MAATNRFLWVLCWLGVISAAMWSGLAQAERVHRFTVSIDPELKQIDVKACFDGQPPATLVAESLDATIALISVRNDATGKEIRPSGYIPLKSVAGNGCVTYRVDVSRPVLRHDRTGGKIRRVGTDVAISAGLWLWRPENPDADADVELAFDLPDGIAVSVPWLPVDGADRPTFRLGRTPVDWPAWTAFGRFTESEVEVAGSKLRIAVLDGSPPVDVASITDWVADAAGMVGGLYGRFPYPWAQVLVVPNARAREPAPWAFVVRGGGPGVHFVINQRRAMEEFYDDWTAAHEFSHLFLPLVDSRDAWLSEGVATYYQNVLRARSGRMTAQEAWSDLHAGFDRGRSQARNFTLAEATRRMHRSRFFMRVYWSGTAIAMLADIRLRKISNGSQSLDTALAALNACCLDMRREWRARELFARLDELTGTTVFIDLLNEHVESTRFPDLSETYDDLGLVPAGRRSVRLQSDAPLAGLRDSIMTGEASILLHASSEFPVINNQ
ncbi:MAG TPA: hypothetical protein VMW70_15770 [Burkholderiales bacterium]|nr:hypothetical protein [Burkholderiales bacterium]